MVGTVSWDQALILCHLTLSPGRDEQLRIELFCRMPSWCHRELLVGENLHTFGDQKCQKSSVLCELVKETHTEVTHGREELDFSLHRKKKIWVFLLR